MYHKAVMVNEVIEALSVKKDGVYVDATFGGGGHASAILTCLENGRLVAFDQDDDACGNVPDDARLIFVNQNFRYLKNFLKWHQCIPVDGILADLGISSHQIDMAERGFSTRYGGPLDMRMNRKAGLTASKVINTYSVEQLTTLFSVYGELRNARRIALAIERQRREEPIETTERFTDLLRPLVPRGRESKYFAQAFQALRIEVNGEMDALRELLTQSLEVLKQGGRLVVISYHSLEDRLVKNFMKTGNFEGTISKDFFGHYSTPLKMLSKAITASAEEVSQNSRARSARLRVAEKL
ncbi:MAG: 16S rRNA (cytosine(1402)-N(4))-methyltransferase RsmH [Bacteroidales bacterium]|nr:16S rRNA (cytosine(1402)-N(4))-methyltransferase RsmH [Bacteroidales bacterium]